MLRAAVSIYLMLATLAGPWFCCCTTFQLIDWLAPPPTPDEVAPSPCACCCCDSNQKEDNPTGNPGGQPETPTAPSECPCQQQRSELVPVLTAEAASLKRSPTAELFLLVYQPAGLFPLDLYPVVTPRGPENPGGRPMPFLTTDALLHDLHQLRC
jgi:hypothetical protein